MSATRGESRRGLVDLAEHHAVPLVGTEPDQLTVDDAVVDLPHAHPEDELRLITGKRLPLVRVDEVLAPPRLRREPAVEVHGHAADDAAPGDQRGVERDVSLRGERPEAG